ncbi:MAG TPA: hypothetical protein PLF27_01065 [Sedimentibacter sp.]|jgi:hypothetical protein|nr:hypothetical protein [Sedimentibacter sp.]HRC79952.1 hypothetical protein [Sedimentibacter sp.]
MKETIVNTIVLILIFNLIMIVFPDGKTQKFCRISIKLLIMIFILDNIFLKGSLNVNFLESTEAPAYEREVNLNSPEIIDFLNKEIFGGEEVVSDIILSFNKEMEVSASIYIRRMLGNDETHMLKASLAEILQVKRDNIQINGGKYE